MEKCVINVLGTNYRIILKELKNADIDGFTDNTAKEIVIRTDNVNNVGDFDFLQKKAVETRNYSCILVGKWMAVQLATYGTVRTG